MANPESRVIQKKQIQYADIVDMFSEKLYSHYI